MPPTELTTSGACCGEPSRASNCRHARRGSRSRLVVATRVPSWYGRPSARQARRAGRPTRRRGRRGRRSRGARLVAPRAARCDRAAAGVRGARGDRRRRRGRPRGADPRAHDPGRHGGGPDDARVGAAHGRSAGRRADRDGDHLHRWACSTAPRGTSCSGSRSGSAPRPSAWTRRSGSRARSRHSRRCRSRSRSSFWSRRSRSGSAPTGSAAGTARTAPGGRRVGDRLAFVAWSLVLVAIGLRTTFRLPWRGVVGALALARVIIAAFAVLPSALYEAPGSGRDVGLPASRPRCAAVGTRLKPVRCLRAEPTCGSTCRPTLRRPRAPPRTSSRCAPGRGRRRSAPRPRRPRARRGSRVRGSRSA